MSLEYTIVLTPEGRAASVALSRGRRMLLDVADAEQLPRRAVSLNNRGYAFIEWGGRRQFVHRLVCPPAPGLEVDHINHDRRDNRRANLRAVSHALNLLAARHRRRGGPYRGVCAWRGRFRARVGWHGRLYDLGCYASALVAALARDDGVVRITGHAEGLNFPHAVAPHAVRALLASFGADRFGVMFVRRTDGAVRRMICRSEPLKRADAQAHAVDPARRHLWPVWDLREKDYRFIPLEGILCLTHERKRYRVTVCGC
jgi:hypothetical protein